MGELAVVHEFQTTVGKVIEQFLYSKERRNRNTFIAYKTDIEQMLSGIFNKNINTVTKEDFNSLNLNKLNSYINNLYKLAKCGKIKCSNNTINRKQSSIKELIKYLKARGVIDSDISYLELLESLPDDTESIEYMPKDVALQYAEYFLKHEQHKALEKHLLVLLALDTGLRLGELLSLKWSQFVIEDEIVVMRGRGKGNKKWIEKIDYNKMYLPLTQLKKNNNINVFSLNRKNVADMMNRAKKALNYEDRKYTFHSFKKTAVTFTKQITGSAEEAQKKGRHESLATTKIYLEEEEHLMTGVISLGNGVDENLYKKVDHETLLEALGEMSKDSLFVLNVKLAKKEVR